MLNSLKIWLARRKIYNQTVKELSALTNRELLDLGLSKDMIPHIAHEATYGGSHA